MKTPTPNRGIPVAIAVSAFLVGSFVIVQLQNLPNRSSRPEKLDEEKAASATAEACIKNPANVECENIDHRLLNVDTSSRLRSALLTYKSQAEPQNPTPENSLQAGGSAVKSAELFAACKKYISQVMGRDPSAMSSDYLSDGGTIAGISYIRSSDQKQFRYECKIEGTNIIWRGIDIFAPGEGPGRWRNEDAQPLAAYL